MKRLLIVLIGLSIVIITPFYLGDLVKPMQHDIFTKWMFGFAALCIFIGCAGIVYLLIKWIIEGEWG